MSAPSPLAWRLCNLIKRRSGDDDCSRRPPTAGAERLSQDVMARLDDLVSMTVILSLPLDLAYSHGNEDNDVLPSSVENELLY
ncbi:hypothetical protein OPV22_007886 [Ensete ventricosum]|uniref:Uncharacterized protein n=1 Tax=Ensete ventricosum TaxID=4639 RepID=A0AAV8PNI9_ENSVE|nr:hypothetical protein OPV22_007886 [Ensete ventricosum]